MLLFLTGIVGFAAALLGAGLWAGAALLFGFAPPTPDQIGGLALMLGSAGVLAGAVMFVVCQ